MNFFLIEFFCVNDPLDINPEQNSLFPFNLDWGKFVLFGGYTLVLLEAIPSSVPGRDREVSL